MSPLHTAVQVALVGVGATAVLDIWLMVLNRLGVPTLNFAFIGRWVGHLARGRFAHRAIANSAPIPAEAPLGWLTHYAVGIAFAMLLFAIQGLEWARQPTLLPAVAVGVSTAVIPLFVMQPAMGAGFAGSKTSSPIRNCLRSLANHTVFGAGLFLAATLVNWTSQ
jgi:hypothetical protein